MFVNRGRITGKPIEEQDADPKLKESIMADVEKLYKGNTAKMGDHMGNFFEAWKYGKWPISDVESQHRSVSACHLAQHLDSAEAQAHLGRRQGAVRRRQRGRRHAQAGQRSPYTLRSV